MDDARESGMRGARKIERMLHVDEGERRSRGSDQEIIDGLLGFAAEESWNSRESENAAPRCFRQDANGGPGGNAVLKVDSGLGGGAAGVSFGFGLRGHEVTLLRKLRKGRRKWFAVHGPAQELLYTSGGMGRDSERFGQGKIPREVAECRRGFGEVLGEVLIIRKEAGQPLLE